MDRQRYYAVLDTDFVSKGNIIRNQNRVLMDEVLGFPGYQFFCHQKMRDELGDHGTRPAQEWLEKKIEGGEISCYSDEQIIRELKELVHNSCYSYYRSFLKQGCDLFNANLYKDHFNYLDSLLETQNFSETDFLSTLNTCEQSIGHQKSYGEVKAFVLTQTLTLLRDAEVYIFCSDDFGARRGFANGAQIPCMSVLSVFMKLKLIEKPKQDIAPYYSSFIRWCTERENPQTCIKVWNYRDGSDKRIKVPVYTLLDDIYSGKYQARKDGDLQRIISDLE